MAPARLTNLPAGALLLLGALVFAVYRQGAYHQWQHQVFSGLLASVALFLALTSAGRRGLAIAAVVVSPLLASSLVSTIASSDRSDAGSTFLEIGLVGIAMAAGIAVPRESLDLGLDAVLLLAGIVGATAIVGVATHAGPWGRVTEGIWRGSSSLTYANAAAAVVAPAALLSFGLASRGSRVHAVAATFLLVAFASTQSRGGALALLFVSIAAALWIGWTRSVRTALPIVAGLAVGTPLLLLLAPDSSTTRPLLVFALVIAGCATTFSTWPMRERIARPTLALAAIGLAGISALVATGAADSIGARVSFRSGTTAGGEDAGVLFGDRANEWRVAWDRFTEEPILGHGPGVVDLQWEEGRRSFSALFVHNEYLELAVTHGLLGLVALASGGWLLARRITIDAKSQAIAIALAAFLIHSFVDFLWHLPALPVLFAFLAGLPIDSER